MTVPGNHTHRFHQKHNICTTRKLQKKKTQAQRKQVCSSAAQTEAQGRLLLRPRPAQLPVLQEWSKGNLPRFGTDPQVKQRQQPHLFISVWFRQRQDRKTISLENQQWAFSSTFLCYENQEDSAQNSKRGNWDSHGRNKLVPIPEPVTTPGCVVEPSPERADHTRLPPRRRLRGLHILPESRIISMATIWRTY